MATPKKTYGIFYKSRGKWSKTPWKWNFKTHTIESLTNALVAVKDAKYFLKSKFVVKELAGNKWIQPKSKLLINN